MREFDVSVARDGAAVVVSVSGEVDIATAPMLSTALSGGRTLGAAQLIVDLREVTFIDCAGLRALTAAGERLAGRLRVIPSPACLRLFELAAVGDLFVVERVEAPGGGS